VTRDDAIEVARAFVDQRFPEALAAFLAGSVIRGDATATSDLDIVVLTEREEAPFRESLREGGWPIELFVHTPDSLRRYLARDIDRRRPVLIRMCDEGIVLRDRAGTAARVKEEARELLSRGPAALAEEEIDQRRYGVTDLLDDFEGCEDRLEGLFIAAELAAAAAELLLLRQGRWIGRGKWVPRALRELDPRLVEQLAVAMRAFAESGTKDGLIRFAEDALAPSGGRLFEGYRASGT
jgi:predicted nucleotidyltransferase